MPIYGYACQNCEHTLDALQKIADEPLTDCPECGTAGLRRKLSAPRFRLKGQGWYETDFKSDNKRNLADDKAESSDKGDGKADSKAATDKPAAKPDTQSTTPAKGSADKGASGKGGSDKASA